MWRRWLAYLRWLPGTVHLHGIHSPFIYQLKKEVFKTTAKKKSPDNAFAKAFQTQFRNESNLLEKLKTFRRIADFFDAKKILLVTKNPEVLLLVFQYEREVSAVTIKEIQTTEPTNPFDLIYLNGNETLPTKPQIKELISLSSTITCWLLDNKNASEAAQEFFDELKHSEAIKQTIDCHWFGLILFREAQPKENFKIYP
ncbi:MAG: hypothetical protein WBG71_14575 [Leeuwenhoekiella sp.]